MSIFEQNLHISDSAFECMRTDADRVLQKMIKNMVDKESLDGSVTIKIEVTLIPEYIPNYDPEVEGETRKVLKPTFTHKVGSMMQIKDERKGGSSYENMELVWDEEAKEYVLKPICNTEQRSIFDADFKCYEDDVVEDPDQSGGFSAIEAAPYPALPGTTEEPEDISDQIFDDYDYEEQEEE